MVQDIRFEDFSVRFPTRTGAVTAVNHVSAVFRGGRITGLIGESGSGKSVLGMAVLRLLPSSAILSGSCYYGQADLLAMDKKQMRRLRGKEISIIPQNPAESLNPMRKIGSQLTEGLTVHKLLKKRPAAGKVEALLTDFGLSSSGSIMKKYSFEMSGGMNQRILSVLGLACGPQWLIADEPTKGLDAVVCNQVYETLKKAARETTGSMLLITHDLKLAASLCEELYVLYAGNILEHGMAKEVLGHPMHPYTRGLIASLPENGMHPIPGSAPEKGGDEAGCPFYARCSYATERCKNQMPDFYTAENGTEVRCVLYA